VSAATDSRQGKAAGTSPEFEQRVAGIRQSLELLHEPGAVFEIRALGVRSGKYANTWSGYYNDFAKAAKDIAALDANRKPKGIYTTLNPVNPALLGRANNRMVERPETRPKTAKSSAGAGSSSTSTPRVQAALPRMVTRWPWLKRWG
jgi:hypothetical protein